ncbi:hypothetical protein [Paenibacillus phytorum]|uniref:hypothetical protein n=1 Tax=Paenibacillus phytorum TaxID=2654977 RepID=UPI00149140FD|nr:hypothetical protein [Paenibacillus phytorum]
MVKKSESHRDQESTYSQENTKSTNVQELSTLFDLQTEELRKPEDEIKTIRGN